LPLPLSAASRASHAPLAPPSDGSSLSVTLAYLQTADPASDELQWFSGLARRAFALHLNRLKALAAEESGGGATAETGASGEGAPSAEACAEALAIVLLQYFANNASRLEGCMPQVVQARPACGRGRCRGARRRRACWPRQAMPVSPAHRTPSLNT
jgi:hypothetical protein